MGSVRYAGSPDGTRIAYRASGDGDPLVLVHGSATSSADWIFVLPFLRERFTVVTMDRRGRGRSGDGPKYSMEREAEDILAVLAAVGGELLVGHSYGALCSMLAAERTDRLRRLVLYEPPIAIHNRNLPELEASVRAGDLDTVLAGFLGSAGVAPEQLETIRSSRGWPNLLRAVPALPRELWAASEWSPPTSGVATPTLLLVGGETRSSVYLDGLDELEAAFPNARREVIPGQHHVAHVFAAEAFARFVAGFCAD
jgi:pimeloyl-ACP methyl ester carboxylesterase